MVKIMATSSFSKNFVIKRKKSVKILKNELKHKNTIFIHNNNNNNEGVRLPHRNKQAFLGFYGYFDKPLF
jgi:hypothetical protein